MFSYLQISNTYLWLRVKLYVLQEQFLLLTNTRKEIIRTWKFFFVLASAHNQIISMCVRRFWELQLITVSTWFVDRKKSSDQQIQLKSRFLNVYTGKRFESSKVLFLWNMIPMFDAWSGETNFRWLSVECTILVVIDSHAWKEGGRVWLEMRSEFVASFSGQRTLMTVDSIVRHAFYHLNQCFCSLRPTC